LLLAFFFEELVVLEVVVVVAVVAVDAGATSERNSLSWFLSSSRCA